ncbi:hypothetical protein C1646_766975 [Rhizophagus diaphanus]|nr:hypothetical protein C1646_766975 [Rhizophagus diaphanus] [Rhizophagus sp. MUCL 43196]
MQLNVGNARSGRVNLFAPLMDIHENDNEFLVSAELPGLNKDQINIDIHDNNLVISADDVTAKFEMDFLN